MNDLEKAVREATPSWMTDGFGVRGPAPATPVSANVVRRSDASDGAVKRPAEESGGDGGGTVELPDTTVITGTHNGIPSTLEVYSNGGWRQLPPPVDPP